MKVVTKMTMILATINRKANFQTMMTASFQKNFSKRLYEKIFLLSLTAKKKIKPVL